MIAWLIYEMGCLFLCVFFGLDWSYSAIMKKYDVPQLDYGRYLCRLRRLTKSPADGKTHPSNLT